MNIWALADLHLSFSVPQKSMEIFGKKWKNYTSRIQNHWKAVVKEDDIVLIAGDISWAINLEEALIDLKWIDHLPGKKILTRGNHDYWWASKKKMGLVMPPSIQFIQNDSIVIGDIAFAGTRLWNTSEYSFSHLYESTVEKKEDFEISVQKEMQEKIFARELQRLKLSLASIPKEIKKRIVMTHYPPIGNDLHVSKASAIIEKFHVQHVVFGHLHNLDSTKILFGKKNGIAYHLTSCDYLDFRPLLICSV